MDISASRLTPAAWFVVWSSTLVKTVLLTKPSRATSGRISKNGESLSGRDEFKLLRKIPKIPMCEYRSSVHCSDASLHTAALPFRPPRLLLLSTTTLTMRCGGRWWTAVGRIEGKSKKHGGAFARTGQKILAYIGREAAIVCAASDTFPIRCLVDLGRLSRRNRMRGSYRPGTIQSNTV